MCAGKGDATRVVLKLADAIAPYKAAVFPLVKKPEQMDLATALHKQVLQHVPAEFDSTQSIGKRYRRQDEIGTPLCITVDAQSVSDGSVTVRLRDSMRQVRMSTTEILERCATNRFTQAALELIPSGHHE